VIDTLSVTTKRARERKSFMIKNKVTFFYLLMLVAHLAHIFEETWGRFFLIDAVFGLGWFLVTNWLLFCILVVFFYFVLNDKPWAYYMRIVYAGIMVLNGVAHAAATITTGKYFNGFAGGYTGIGLVLIGPR
jgi:hypothetical protein